LELAQWHDCTNPIVSKGSVPWNLLIASDNTPREAAASNATEA
jgi:hypothetical protein